MSRSANSPSRPLCCQNLFLFLAKEQCFGSIFIVTGSCQKSESGSRKPPDPDLSCFLSLPGNNIELFCNYEISCHNKSIERYTGNVLKSKIKFFSKLWIRIRNTAKEITRFQRKSSAILRQRWWWLRSACFEQFY